jgi:small subunit ribosomal protein S16
MLAIRYFRTGKKNQPYFKVIVTDRKSPTRGGRFVEEVGSIDPVKKVKKINAERIKYWISVGAQPSDTVYNLLVSEKVIEGKKRDVHNKKKLTEAEIKAAEAAKIAPVAAAKPVETPAEKPTEVPVETPVEAPKEEKKEEPKVEAPATVAEEKK